MTFDELCAAAQQGDPDAQFELGGFWWERNNYERATEWYTLSAEQGHIDAQFSLGAYYHSIHQDEQIFPLAFKSSPTRRAGSTEYYRRILFR